MSRTVAIDILFLDSNYMRGLSTYSREILDSLSAEPSEARFVVFAGRCPLSFFESIDPERFEIVRIPLSQGNRLLRLVAQQMILPLFVIKHRVSLIHSLNNPVPFLAPAKVVMTAHDLLHLDMPQSVSRWRRMVRHAALAASLRRAWKVAAISQFTAKRLSTHFQVSAEKLEVVRHGVKTPDAFRPRSDSDDKYILSLGAGYPHKNTSTLLSAFAQSELMHEMGIRLVLPGLPTETYAELQRLAADLGISQRVSFPGRVSDEELITLFRGAFLYANTSTYEGFGLTPLEAMTYAVPIVSSEVAALDEVLGDAAYRIGDPTSVDEVREAIERVASDERLRSDLARKGIEHVRQFSWRESARNLTNIYLEKNSGKETAAVSEEAA